MTSRVWPLAVALAALAGSGAAAADGAGSAWGARARARMVADALKVAPPVLAGLITRHEDSLRAGLEEATRSEGTSQHRLDGADPASGAAAAMDTVAGKAIAAMDGHRPISDVVFYLGVLAHLAADVSDPLLTAPEGATAPFAPDFPRYVERNLDRFPAVFYGYPEEPGTLSAVALDSAHLSREYYGHLARAYAESGGSSEGFDVRSIPFGIASLCYSRAVTGIARAWLHVWRGAHGDTGGTPHLASAAPPPKAMAPIPRVARPAPRAPAPPPEAGAGAPDAGALQAAGGEEETPTKVIIGKSRRRLREEAARSAKGAPAGGTANPGTAKDPNTPGDPNG
ncbi:MAG: hypothetical protein HY049_07370 [Acidobacteria bacterium]|nr:hypothetical protein [Acidobacteriota bacterium]